MDDDLEMTGIYAMAGESLYPRKDSVANSSMGADTPTPSDNVPTPRHDAQIIIRLGRRMGQTRLGQQQALGVPFPEDHDG